MNDQNGRCTLTCGFLIFVGPASIIGHRFSAERTFQTGILKVRVVDHDDDRLAFDVDACIIIPALLRGDNAMAYKDHIALLDLGLRCLAVAADDIFAAICKGHRLSAPVGNVKGRNVLGRNFD